MQAVEEKRSRWREKAREEHLEALPLSAAETVNRVGL